MDVKGPPGAIPVQIGNATYYIRPEVEETFKRMQDSMKNLESFERLDRKVKRLYATLILLDVTLLSLLWSGVATVEGSAWGFGIMLGTAIAHTLGVAWRWIKGRGVEHFPNKRPW